MTNQPQLALVLSNAIVLTQSTLEEAAGAGFDIPEEYKENPALLSQYLGKQLARAIIDQTAKQKV